MNHDPRRLDGYLKLMTPGEVAKAFGVHIATVSRWVKQGKITSLKTLGGQSRFDRAVIDRMLRAQQQEVTDADRPGSMVV